MFLGPIFGGHQGHKKRLEIDEPKKCQQPYVSKASIPSFVLDEQAFVFNRHYNFNFWWSPRGVTYKLKMGC